MSARRSRNTALVVSGDVRIQDLLDEPDSVIVPAYACRLDGFVNDTFTEYANASVYRPVSVCRARLVSTLQDSTRFSGRSRMGFTMYTTAGQREPIEMWIGHRLVAVAEIPEPDNRVHLFLAPDAFAFQGGEQIRLVTSETSAPCRIESLVFLPKKPTPTAVRLRIQQPHVDVRRSGCDINAYVTWTTDRPAAGELRWGAGRRTDRKIRLNVELVNHEVVLEGLRPGRGYSYSISLHNRATGVQASHTGRFSTGVRSPRTRGGRTRATIRLRRSGDGPWPASVGVPFQQGDLGSTDDLRLLSGRTSEIPCQTEPLARWPDGSVQWALVDFTSDGRRDYRVEYGRDVKRDPATDGLRVREDRTGITVTTGPMRIRFARDRVRLPGAVSVRQPDGSYRKVTRDSRSAAVTLVGSKGDRFASGKPDAVVLETSGPERACVRIDLAHTRAGGRLFRSRFRVHVFRGSSRVRVVHTFTNDRTDEAFTQIRRVSLRTDLDPGRGLSGHISRHAIKPTIEAPCSLVQTHDNGYSLKRANRTIAKGRRAEGTVIVSGSDAEAGLCVRDFWQNYPKGLTVDSTGITIDLCPEIRKGDYPKGGELEDRLYYYLLDGGYKLKSGVSRTHELWFEFGAPGAVDVDALHSGAQQPPLYSVSLETFNRSQAITRLPSKARPPFPPYEDWVEGSRQAYAEDREESRAYGMLNFGDWFGERTYNWGNMEYDPSWCFLQEYLRGGHPDFYTWAEEAARHLVDVDTCQASEDPDEIGAQYLHSVGHVGGYYPDGFRERAIFTGRSSVSHTWVEGLFLYHLLTGDPQVLEAAMQTSDRLIGGVLNHYDFTNCRNCGWHLIHLSAAYKATGRRVYLNGARIIVDRVLERQRDSGGWDRLMVPGHCHCNPPRHTGNAGFMVGILMVGLKRFYEATGEKRVADAIVRAADFCIDSMWVPENSAFRYTSCPHSSAGFSADMRILKGVATAYQFSRKPRFRNVLEAGVRSSMGRGRPKAHRGVGKSICSPMRGAPQVLVDMPKGIKPISRKGAKTPRGKAKT